MSELKETKKMKVTQLHEQNPKQFLNPTPAPKIANWGSKKSKMAPKLSQNQKVESKKTQKIIKVVQLHQLTPKQLLYPTMTPKIALQDPKKVKKDPKIKSKSKVRIERTIENKNCSST